eukprot:TRINITY_DN2354_c0_g1_i1.p1 TRINITY_DN2354_c0_g1~~TRINITY_DN2354_c0_g1_i1.p1  ORF type:complete len:227 (-),score=46.02 TRINITY_DN2354_c0_g1_i1:114-794(-)
MKRTKKPTTTYSTNPDKSTCSSTETSTNAMPSTMTINNLQTKTTTRLEENEYGVASLILEVVVNKHKGRPSLLEEVVVALKNEDGNDLRSDEELILRVVQKMIDLAIISQSSVGEGEGEVQLIYPTLPCKYVCNVRVRNCVFFIVFFVRDPLSLIESLREIDNLNQQINQFEPESVYDEIEQQHIQRLHDYNDAKDTGQALMGRLAMKEGVLVKDIYPRFDLDLAD